MDKNDKIRVAVTSGIIGLILLILILFLALNGNMGSDDENKLNENISSYMDSSILESTEGKSEVLNDAAKNASSEDATQSVSVSSTEAVSYSKFIQNKKETVSGNSFYKVSVPVLKNVYKNVKYDRDAQMNEMYEYWKDGNQEAVHDLAHLERFEAMSYSLTNTSDYYYYGDVNSQGLPEGTGLAVYAGDQYYFGEFSNGQRSGNGTWIAFYPSYSTYSAYEHMYAGEWAFDMPNGQGQEHFDYNTNSLNSDDIYVQNAIGGFSDGMYDGEMYIITIDNNGDTFEWVGKCVKGTFEQIAGTSKDKRGYIPVLNERENSENHLYFAPANIENNGIIGIISGGKMVK